MSTLVVIFAHSKARETLCRHWGHYQKADCPFVITQPENVAPLAPVPAGHSNFYGTIKCGREPYTDGQNHLVTFFSTLASALEASVAWDQICLTEYDSLFFRPVPQMKGPGIMTTLAGHRNHDFRGENFYHAPWVMQRNTVEFVLDRSARMLRAGLIECGYVDRFFGLLMDLYPEVPHIPSGCYSKNTIHKPEWMAEARSAVKAGAWHVHGCKTEDQFQQLTQGL